MIIANPSVRPLRDNITRKQKRRPTFSGRSGDTAWSMSQENVDLVRRAVAAVNARDIDRYLACCTEDVELRTPLAPIGGVYEGPDDIRRFFADIEDTAPDFRLELDRVEAIGEDRVLAFLRVSASGRTTGIPTPADTTNLY